MTGWICMHRSFTQWEWYTDANTSRLFIHCLLTANHKTKSWRGITIERGQFLTSLDSLSDNLGLTKQQVRTALNKLKKTHEITLKTSSRNTVVTVSQYEKYQSPTHEATREVTHKQHTDNTQITPTNNVTMEQCNKKEVSVAKAPPVFHEEVINLYHAVLPELKGVVVSRWAGSQREKDLRTRVKEHPDHSNIEFWRWLFSSVKFSDWHMGRSGNWSADLGWLLKRANFDKMVELASNASTATG
jgi:hypothetical protein